MMFHVRPETGEPIYQQLVRQIKYAVITGALRPNDKLPTVRKLAAELVINPNTVARAYRELERDGLVNGGPGRGTFVRELRAMFTKEERVRRISPQIEHLLAEAGVLGIKAAELVDLIKRFSKE